MGGPQAEHARQKAAAWRRFRGGGRPPTGGPGIRGCGGRRARTGAVRGPDAGRPRWQLPGVRAAAPCSPWRRGQGHRFPGWAARSPARGTQRGDGATRAVPAPPHTPRHDEWASGARPRRKRAPPARPAKRSGTRPGARPGPPGSLVSEGGRAGVRASSRASGKRQGPS